MVDDGTTLSLSKLLLPVSRMSPAFVRQVASTGLRQTMSLGSKHLMILKVMPRSRSSCHYDFCWPFGASKGSAAADKKSSHTPPEPSFWWGIVHDLWLVRHRGSSPNDLQEWRCGKIYERRLSNRGIQTMLLRIRECDMKMRFSDDDQTSDHASKKSACSAASSFSRS